MQCNALCLYQVCEAGSNGSWWGRVRESCSALGRSLAFQGRVWPAMAQRLRPTKRSWLLTLSLSPLHLKSHPQTVTDGEKDHGSDESTTTPDQITLGLAQPLCNELTSSKSTSQHAEMFFITSAKEVMLACPSFSKITHKQPGRFSRNLVERLQHGPSILGKICLTKRIIGIAGGLHSPKSVFQLDYALNYEADFRRISWQGWAKNNPIKSLGRSV